MCEAASGRPAAPPETDWLPLEWNMPSGAFMTFEHPSILTCIMFTVIHSSSTDLISLCSSWKNKCWFCCHVWKLTTSSSVYRVSRENFPLCSHSGSDPLCADLLVSNDLFVNNLHTHLKSSYRSINSAALTLTALLSVIQLFFMCKPCFHQFQALHKCCNCYNVNWYVYWV